MLAAPAQAFEVLTLGEGDPAVVVDGRLDDAVWQRAAVHRRFAQLQPTAGAAFPDDLRTEVRVVADGKALIIGIRAWSPQPPRSLLSRRDAVQRDQDMIGVWVGHQWPRRVGDVHQGQPVRRGDGRSVSRVR